MDLKLFAKKLANGLLLHISSLVHRDQAGFVPFREPWDNTIQVVNLIHAAKSSNWPLLLLSTDVEKAFNWSFMRASLEHVGLGFSMLSWKMSLYSNPTAALKVNKMRFDFFNIHNGMRQWCPLSPLIFLLALEPFLCMVRADSAIAGFQKASGMHKVAAFAEDLKKILLFSHYAWRSPSIRQLTWFATWMSISPLTPPLYIWQILFPYSSQSRSSMALTLMWFESLQCHQDDITAKGVILDASTLHLPSSSVFQMGKFNV